MSILLQRLAPDADGLAAAAQVLRDGALVAFPTETVYGLGADARNDAAVAGIFAAKARPSFNPLIVHVADIAMARRYVTFNDVAERLAAAFWPGALTLVLPLRADAGIAPLVTAGLPTLAVRVPDHPVGQGLLAAFDGPIAAPSANPSGRISPTTAAHVATGLGGRIGALIEGGASGVGVESTIVSCATPPKLLRAGGVPQEALEAGLGTTLTRDETPERVIAPGQLESHYAPNAKLRLNAAMAAPDEVLLGFGPVDATFNLSPAGDVIEAAATLFGMLHRIDAAGVPKIAVSPIPEVGLGRAINDRLRRAAADR